PYAFASIVQARPCPILGRPVHLWDGSHRLRPGGSPQALQIPPHGGHPALRSPARGGSRSPLAVSRFRVRARVGFSIPASLSLRPVRCSPHLWIATRGPGPGGTLTRLSRVLPGTHYAASVLPPTPWHFRVLPRSVEWCGSSPVPAQETL